MSTREITALAFKLFAMYLIMSAMVMIPPILWSLDRFAQAQGTDYGSGGTVFLVLVGVTVKALFAILAWRISNTISRDILSHPGEKMSCSISSHQLECLLFRVLGVYFVFPNIGVAVSNAVAFQERIASGFSFTYVLIELISVVGVIILGVFLIGKPSVWVNLLRSLRNLGHPKPADGNAATSEDSVGSNDDPE